MSIEKIRSLNDRDLLVYIATKVEIVAGNGQPGLVVIQGNRISALERWRAYMTGAVAVIAAVLLAAVTIGGALLAAKFK